MHVITRLERCAQGDEAFATLTRDEAVALLGLWAATNKVLAFRAHGRPIISIDPDLVELRKATTNVIYPPSAAAGSVGGGEGSRPSSPVAPDAPDGYVVPEGDERCDFVMDACTCMKRKGHDGLHACAHGSWRGSVGERPLTVQEEIKAESMGLPGSVGVREANEEPQIQDTLNPEIVPGYLRGVREANDG
jgi:hypothetical protein